MVYFLGVGSIDIGCSDPIDLSVSNLFYNRGWRGINIDPLPHCIEAHKKMRPEDKNICIGIFNKAGKIRFWNMGSGSTCKEENMLRLRKDKPLAPREIDVITLTELLDSLNWNKPIHFLKVDVENSEKEVLESIDLNRYRPWVMAIESTLPGTPIAAWENWEDILLKNNYTFVCMNAINRYYIANEKKEFLMANFNRNFVFPYIRYKTLKETLINL